MSLAINPSNRCLVEFSGDTKSILIYLLISSLVALSLFRIAFLINIEFPLDSLTNARWLLLNWIFPPVTFPVTKKPCPIGTYCWGTVLAFPTPLIPGGETAAVPPVKFKYA